MKSTHLLKLYCIEEILMNTKGYTVGTYIIKTEKRTLNYLCVLYVRNVKIDPFAEQER